MKTKKVIRTKTPSYLHPLPRYIPLSFYMILNHHDGLLPYLPYLVTRPSHAPHSPTFDSALDGAFNFPQIQIAVLAIDGHCDMLALEELDRDREGDVEFSPC